MKRQNKLPELSPGQAQYILGRMVKERKLDSAEVSRYMSEMHSEIRNLEERLGMLRGAADSSSAPAAAPTVKEEAPSVPVAAPARRRSRKGRVRAARPAKVKALPARPASRPPRKEVKASQQLQGIYLSLIKQLPKQRRPAIQKLCKEQGRQAAIDKMKSTLRK